MDESGRGLRRKHRLHVTFHVVRQCRAQGGRELQQPLFAWMRLPIDGEQDVEIARQQGGYAMMDANGVVTRERQFDLVQVRREIGPQDGMIVGDDGAAL